MRFESQWISSETDLVEVACDSTKWKKEIAERVPDGHPAVLVLASPVQPVVDPGVLVLALLGLFAGLAPATLVQPVVPALLGEGLTQVLPAGSWVLDLPQKETFLQDAFL